MKLLAELNKDHEWSRRAVAAEYKNADMPFEPSACLLAEENDRRYVTLTSGKLLSVYRIEKRKSREQLRHMKRPPQPLIDLLESSGHLEKDD